ncbi:retinoic acid-induced protein 3-like [Eublepharis macularius]|uniref:Retinoic acid-induced protein 3-like n=1 Tax=Eublepharis macularius TaxID=481883 RepID=A0AA97JVB2_EUBMA|nr:retinoic acid-induced protein 3-like [Eublepharis macularius]
MASTTAPPPGCGNIDPDYYFLCDVCAAWGIGLETLAAAGVLASLILLMAFFALSWMVKDKNKKNLIPIQFLFILGTLGIFSLTFAFIIRLNNKTGSVRFILYGVLFALCFSCLLTHASNLIKLVRGKAPLSKLSMLVRAVGLTFIQIIIAVKYIIITVERDGIDMAKMGREQRNKDFVMLLIYVLVLMVFSFMISMFTSCGPYKGWKRHGMHISVTLLFSIAIWSSWISMLLLSGIPTNGEQSRWDDPLISVALVVNGWVFLMMYTIPEICFLTIPHQPEDYPSEEILWKSTGRQQSVEAGSTQAPDKEGAEEDILFPPNGTGFQPKDPKPKPCFSIPRTMLHPAYRQEMMVRYEAKRLAKGTHTSI